MCIKCAHYFFDIVIDHFCRTYKPKTVLKTGLKGYLMYVLVYSNYFLGLFKQKKYSLHWKFPEKYASDQWTIQVHSKKIYASPNIVLSNAIKKWKDKNLLPFFFG